MTPAPDDTIAWVTVRLHAHGQISVSGTIGDKPLAIGMLDQAKDAIRRQVPDAGQIYVPNCDVDAAPNPALREMGDLALCDRGDP